MGGLVLSTSPLEKSEHSGGDGSSLAQLPGWLKKSLRDLGMCRPKEAHLSLMAVPCN